MTEEVAPSSFAITWPVLPVAVARTTSTPRMLPMQTSDGRRRIAIEALRPLIDGGRFPIKRIEGDRVEVTADVFADGHDVVRALLKVRRAGETAWNESPMQSLGNDRWRGELTVGAPGRYEFTIEGWVDRLDTWRRDLAKRREAGQDVASELLVGAGLIAAAARRAREADAPALARWSQMLSGPDAPSQLDSSAAHELWRLVERYPDREFSTAWDPPLQIVVDRKRALFSSWYEMFPRSCAAEAGRHGTIDDCIARLPYVASLGFDVLYLPPIHPIGASFRKGKNNAPAARSGEPGCPWAIGSAEGGHKSIHPQLGTLADFCRLVEAARSHGLEVALDLAYQCSPAHPYVAEHPEWFRRRPDGSVQYAENPPKKYEDIYPFDFESADWRGLWEELKSVVEFWIEQGVRIFRVDNPHTKPLAFWEWMIGSVKSRSPDVIFLSEAFTRPKLMYALAKLGFTQSYTYFTWRNTKAELTDYLTELTHGEVVEHFQPNLWPNTPDILPPHLQHGGRAAAIARLVMAATLSASYGIYGPVFELCESLPREPGSEEYLNSEKYEIRHWDLDRPGNLREVISRVNRARRDNVALQSNGNLRFHLVENEQLLCYTKGSLAAGNLVLVLVNLDAYRQQGGWLHLPLVELGMAADRPYRVYDVLSDASFDWTGSKNYVLLDPQKVPAHLFQVSQA